MWPFRSRGSAPTLDEPAYRRWLRAQRPPLLWFLSLAEAEQEALAAIGEEQRAVSAATDALAAACPDVTHAMAGGEDAEESLAQQVGRAILDKMEAPGRSSNDRPTWSNVMQGQAKPSDMAPRAAPSLFGRVADG